MENTVVGTGVLRDNDTRLAVVTKATLKYKMCFKNSRKLCLTRRKGKKPESLLHWAKDVALRDVWQTKERLLKWMKQKSSVSLRKTANRATLKSRRDESAHS